MVCWEAVVEEVKQVFEPRRKIVCVESRARAAQRHGGQRIGAGGASEAQIDAARMQRLQHPKRLRHF